MLTHVLWRTSRYAPWYAHKNIKGHAKNKPKTKTRHSDIGPSAYFAKLGKKKVNEEKEIEKHRK